MKKIKKILSLILALSTLLALGAAASAEPSSVSQQIDLIYAMLPSTVQDIQAPGWYCAVTDFDRNGRLELLTASGHGLDAQAKAWEVNSSFDGLAKCGFLISSDESLPDMLTESADTFFRASDGTWNYRYSDSDSTQGQFNSIICSLMLLGGNFVYQDYAAQSSEMMNGILAITFTDADGNIITPDEYNTAAAKAFEGCERSSTSFGWIRLADAQASAQFLSDSYAVFIGEKAPDEESVIRESLPSPVENAAVPVQAPAPAAETPQQEKPLPEKTAEGYEIIQYDGPAAQEIVYPSAQEIVYPSEVPVQPERPIIVYPTPTPEPKFEPLYITRNPTNEYRKTDSTAKFVACANKFNRLTWRFVDPSGNEMGESEFRSRFPGSSIDASSTTLSISNVTADMNGWGAYCIFDTDDGQTASTSTAYIAIKA